MKAEELDPQLLGDLEDAYRALVAMGPVASFPWHTQQQYALRADTDIIVVLGGNRSGKTETARGILSRLVRREGPVYKRLIRPEGRPLKIWVVPQTMEKYWSNWEQKTLQALAGLDFTYNSTPSPCFTWNDDKGGGTIWGKSQDQNFRTFESDEVDLIIFDEEPEDQRVFTSAMTRFATTNGVAVLAYTPLLGLTWTYSTFYLPVVKDRYKIADRVWKRGSSVTVVQMGMADNPEAVLGGGVRRLKDDPSITEAERVARLYGTYGFTEGLLIPDFALLTTSEDNPYVITREDFESRILPYRSLNWYLLADPNKRHGALLAAFDHDGNRYYAGEHYAEGLPDTRHADEYRRLLGMWELDPRDVEVFADPGGAGAQAIINLAETGFFAKPVPKDPGSVAASIKRLRRAAYLDPRHRHPVTGQSPAPHAYFIDTLHSEWTHNGLDFAESRLMWEFRQYRQKKAGPGGQPVAPDTPVKEHDDVVDCARYLELVHPESPVPPKDISVQKAREQLDELSRKEAEEFDKVLEQTENRRQSRYYP